MNQMSYLFRSYKPYLITLVIAFASCRQGKFSIHPPKNWTTNDTIIGSKKGKIIMDAPSSKDTGFSVNIMAWFTDFPNADFYINNILKQVKEDAYVFQEKGKGAITINGYKMKWRQHILQVKKTAIPVEQKIFYTTDSGNVYVINCSAHVNEIDSLRDEINEVLNSFKIH